VLGLGLVSREHVEEECATIFRDEFTYDGSPICQSLYAQTGAGTRKWGGNLVVYRKEAFPSEVVLDAEVADLRRAVEYFQPYTEGPMSVTNIDTAQAAAMANGSFQDRVKLAEAMTVLNTRNATR